MGYLVAPSATKRYNLYTVNKINKDSKKYINASIFFHKPVPLLRSCRSSDGEGLSVTADSWIQSRVTSDIRGRESDIGTWFSSI
jgi:hypothetical protein